MRQNRGKNRSLSDCTRTIFITDTIVCVANNFITELADLRLYPSRQISHMAINTIFIRFGTAIPPANDTHLKPFPI